MGVEKQLGATTNQKSKVFGTYRCSSVLLGHAREEGANCEAYRRSVIALSSSLALDLLQSGHRNKVFFMGPCCWVCGPCDWLGPVALFRCHFGYGGKLKVALSSNLNSPSQDLVTPISVQFGKDRHLMGKTCGTSVTIPEYYLHVLTREGQEP